jgi:hypothetical protein
VRHDEVAAPPAGVVRRLDGGHARARSSFVVLVRTDGLRTGVGVSCGVAAGASRYSRRRRRNPARATCKCSTK